MSVVSPDNLPAIATLRQKNVFLMEKTLASHHDIRPLRNDSMQEPEVLWRSHASLLFSNWLNYYVYQLSAFELD